MPDAKYRVTVRLPADLAGHLRTWEARYGRGHSELVRMALDVFDPEMHPKLAQEPTQAWQQWSETHPELSQHLRLVLSLMPTLTRMGSYLTRLWRALTARPALPARETLEAMHRDVAVLLHDGRELQFALDDMLRTITRQESRE